RDGNGEIIHVIGKDIIQQHTVFWPAMLKGAGYAEPRAITATGFVTLDDKGVSTSRNRAIWAEEILDEGFHPDPVRYYLISAGNIQRDIDFTWESFAEQVNTDLVGCIGNFLYRSLVFAHRYWDGTPAVSDSHKINGEIESAMGKFQRALNNYSLRTVSEIPLELARFGNKYIQKHEPWKLIDESPDQAARVLRDCVQLTKAIAILFEPIAPEKAETLWTQLGEDGSVHKATIEESTTSPPNQFGEPQKLFKQIEDDRVVELKKKLQAKIK
ncbi:MAG: methionyl-tRNA synthetase, partial [halophilic archaeon J07HX5]